MKAQSGFRVTIKCYNRSSELTLLRVLMLSHNSRRQLPEYQNEFFAYLNFLATHMNSTKLDLRGTIILSI